MDPEVETSNLELDIVNGVACPVDPMDLLQCESCQ